MGDNIALRDMRPEEGKTLLRLARKAFSPIEALGASEPRQAVVATVDGEIAGAMFLKIFTARDGRKIGYLDLGFTLKEYRGRGIGKLFYPAAVKKLEAEGCDIICAMVKDDNAASWGLLARQGFSSPGYLALLREFGWRAGLMLWLKTVFCIACGMNFWMSRPLGQAKSFPEMGAFLLVNMLFVLLRTGYAALRGSASAPYIPLAGLLVLAAGLLAGYLGTLLGGGKWRFGLTRGGLLISGPLLLLGTFFPVLGRWYPASFENSPAQKSALGRQAACEWALLLGLYVLLAVSGAQGALRGLLLQYLPVLLYCRVAAVYPFEHFGGARVFRWNKLTYVLLSAVTIAATFLL